jgi:hypothetical protein
LELRYISTLVLPISGREVSCVSVFILPQASGLANSSLAYFYSAYSFMGC